MKNIKAFEDPRSLVLHATTTVIVVKLTLASQAATYSYTDLNPNEYADSYGLSTSDGQQAGHGGGRARLWSGTASSAVDMNPSNFTGSVISGTSTGQQVGQGFGPGTGNNTHALLWSGTANSVIDLNPIGFRTSQLRGTSGNQHVGWGSTCAGGCYNHALLWVGSANSVTDLNPAGFAESYAWGNSFSQQVGTGYGPATGNYSHALLWSGTPTNVVDLNPSEFAESVAFGVSGDQQVGYGQNRGVGNFAHALLWSGTASRVVDLNPSGFTSSHAYGTSGAQQVGSGSGPATGDIYTTHALVWSGTPGSVVDLHSFLSSDYANSEAFGIDGNGNIIGWAMHTPTGRPHAILWSVIPETVTLCNDPGQCGAVWTCSTSGNTATCSPPSGSFLPIGSTIVTCTTTNHSTNQIVVTINDCEPPTVSCRPYKPPGQSKTQKNSDREENPGGRYQLLGHDNCDPNPRLYIQDSSSGFLAGPFASGDIVKITKIHGQKDSDDSGKVHYQIVAHIRLQGDGLLYGVDANGNVGTSDLCRAPHPGND